VRDGVTGWLAPAGSPLAPVITRALDELSDPARAKKIAAECRQWARTFTWDDTAHRLARVVQSEITRKDQRRPSGRRPIDLAAVAAWPPEQAEEVESILQKELRVTDMITRGDDGLRVLLTGCDEVGAAQVLSRVTVPPQRLRLATTSEVLRGSGDGGAA
jgi:hypothetical protein